jgi:hypothetical protein
MNGVRAQALGVVALAAFAVAFVMASTYSEAYRAVSADGFDWRRYLAQVEAKLREDGVVGAGGLTLPTPARLPAKGGIPGRARAAYLAGARHCRGLHPAVLAAVGAKESDHGRHRGSGVQSGRNPGAGERGPFQFTDPQWARYGRGNVYDLEDAAAAAARKLCADGAPRNYRVALRRYNGAWAYADDVLARARRYDREVF